MKISVPRIVRQDFGRKATAFFFAVLVWFYVQGQLREQETYMSVPVTLQYDENQMGVERAEAVTVNVTLRGSRRVLQQTRSIDLLVTAKLPAVTKGVYFYDLLLSEENVKAPAGTRVSAVEPAHHWLAVDRVETRTAVPVKVRFGGRLREGYEVVKCTVVPAAIELRGPSKLVEGIQEALTEPVPLDESLVNDFEMNVRLAPVARLVPTTDQVHLQVTVAKQTVLQTYKDLPVFVLGDGLQAVTTGDPLSPVSVVLQGNQSVLESLDAFALRAFVDVSGIEAPGRYRRPVQIWTGGMAAVTVESVTPSLVDVVLVPRPATAVPAEPTP